MRLAVSHTQVEMVPRQLIKSINISDCFLEVWKTKVEVSLSSHWRNLNQYLPGEYWKPPDCRQFLRELCSLCPAEAVQFCIGSLNTHSVSRGQREGEERKERQQLLDQVQEENESALRSSLMNIQIYHDHAVSSSGAIQADPPERAESFAFRTCSWKSFVHVFSGRDWAGSHISCMTGVTQMLLDISSSWFLLCQSHTDTSVGPVLTMWPRQGHN